MTDINAEYRRTITSLLIILSFHCCFSQNNTKDYANGREPPIFSTGIGIQHGFIFAHSEAVQNTEGANPTGVEIIFSWQRNDSAIWELCNCYPRKGLLLSYYDFNTPILGKGITTAYFLEPTYKLGKNIFFSFKGAAGISYLTNPFDSISNPTNQSYSQFVNGYLSVGAGIWFSLNDHWWINLSANYNHESNGGMKRPNKGINWPVTGITLSYQKQTRNFYSGTRRIEKFWKNKPLRWDAGVFGVPRRTTDEDGNRKHQMLFGANFQAAKQVGRINKLTLGTEIYYDAELKQKLKRDSLNASPIKAGILFGHEFILGKFIFSQRLGYYVFDQTPYFNDLYHRWGLQYRFNPRISAGFNLNAHQQVADYVDLRITYSMEK